MANKDCTKCIHKEVCKTAESCDGCVSGCKHFKEEQQGIAMDVREKLVEKAISHFWYGISHDIFSEPVTTYAKLAIEALEKETESGVTVQECKVVEIDQFKLPIDDAILILTEELKQMSDGYTTHLAYGGKGDPAMEANLNALELAISALESQKRMMPQPPKGD